MVSTPEYVKYMKSQDVFREKLYAYMRERKIGIVELGRRVAISFGTLNRFLNDGKNVRFTILLRIEEFLCKEGDSQEEKKLV